MKLSTLKTIAITSLATVMLGSVSVVQADMSQKNALAKKAQIEKTLKNLIYKPLPETGGNAAGLGGITNPFEQSDSSNTRRIDAPTRGVSEVPGCNPLPEFNFIGVDDQGLNNSDFFVMDLTRPDNDPQFIDYLTNGRHEGYDIEGLDSTNSPFASCLWATSGDNDNQRDNPDCETGCLYKVHKTDGSLNSYGDICTTEEDLVEVDAIAFRVNQDLGWQQLWGWAQHQGLFQMSTPFSEPNMCGDGRDGINVDMVCEYKADEPTPEPDKNKFNDLVVEDLTWVNKLGIFYIAIDQAIFMLNPEGCGFQFVCINQTEIETTEYLSISNLDLLVVGFHDPDKRQAQNSVAAIDLNDPTKNGVFCKFLPTNFPMKMDVEGLAYP